ncbi:hypothetical protein HMPREF1318_0972 [Actinomyces massiliensis F0489]|uniref:Uncharacterized protein n=1 Tax=Actinomyces massiliensis F0489 TaxID=1125718 RepID=J0NG17_9ACTO|nr:hypothetical protein HMPREF1318_0972 [Actinomyces massiliensis F0489]
MTGAFIAQAAWAPRRDRSGSAPRSVVLRFEIGPVPRRDRRVREN